MFIFRFFAWLFFGLIRLCLVFAIALALLDYGRIRYGEAQAYVGQNMSKKEVMAALDTAQTWALDWGQQLTSRAYKYTSDRKGQKRGDQGHRI